MTEQTLSLRLIYTATVLTAQTVFTLINPQTKALALKIFAFEDNSWSKELKNYSYYSMVLVSKGKGKVRSDLSEYDFEDYTLMSFAVYQSFMIRAEGEFKGLLINGSRMKINQEKFCEVNTRKEPFILQTLKDAIEEHYKKKHSAGEYADLLNISTKALNRISKTHFNRTLTNLIAERIIIEAKRELYLTSKPVKKIAYELGFNDEFYFSRLFKSNAEVSPQLYRDTVGFARAEG